MTQGRSKITDHGTQYIRNTQTAVSGKAERLITLNLEPTEGSQARVGFITFSATTSTASLGGVRFENALVILDLTAFEGDFDLIYSLLKDEAFALDVVWNADDATNQLTEWAILKNSKTGLKLP